MIVPSLTTLLVLPEGMALGKVKLDLGLASFDTVSGVSGNLSSVGPDTFIVKHLERIADHATNIAPMVIFLCEGRDVRHASAAEIPPSNSSSERS